MDAVLDRWLDRPVVRTHHARAAAVTPDALWRAAQSVRLADTRVLGRVIVDIYHRDYQPVSAATQTAHLGAH